VVTPDGGSVSGCSRDRVLRSLHDLQHLGFGGFPPGQGRAYCGGRRIRSGQRCSRCGRGVAGDRVGRRSSPQACALMIALLTLLVGAAGAVTRFLVDAEVKRRWPTTFPWATFGIKRHRVSVAGNPGRCRAVPRPTLCVQTVVGTGSAAATPHSVPQALKPSDSSAERPRTSVTQCPGIADRFRCRLRGWIRTALDLMNNSRFGGDGDA